MLAVLVAWALIPLVILFVRAGMDPSLGSDGRLFTGTDGPDIVDQLQYMAWIRDAGEHVLFSDRFDLVSDPHLFLHPMFVLSGLAWKLGVGIQLSFLLWKPVAVIVLFAGFAAYIRRMVAPEGWARPAALFVALFFVTPAAWVLDWGGIGTVVLRGGASLLGAEMFPGTYVWGVFPVAIAVGLMPVFLLCIERALEPAGRSPARPAGWYAAAAGAAGMITSWVHPWQGLTLLLITGGLIAWSRLWRRAILAVPIAATLAPLAYFFVLTHTHSAWRTAPHPWGAPHLSTWFFLAVAPPLLLAAAGVPGRALDLQGRALRLWPLAAFTVYFALNNSWFYHALDGISLPLTVLAVQGWRRLRLPGALAIPAVAVATIPGMAYYVEHLRDTTRAHFISRDDAAALRYLERAPPGGGVLTTAELGQAVPAFAGRSTWVGHPTWTPDYVRRSIQAESLFAARVAPDQARAFVRKTGAAWLLSGCGHPDLRPALGPIISGARRFGCATVYQVAPGHGSG